LYDSTADWSNWRRGTDFYEEGELLWLDVDSTLRMVTNDKKSIDDFCKIFHGGDTVKAELKTYTFEDVVATLNQVAPYDWAGFLRARLDGVATKTPEEALTNSGWRLEYDDQPNLMEEIEEGGRGADLTFSLGLTIGGDGSVVDVIHDGPAYKAGIGPGMKIVAVNGAQYSPDGIHDAIDGAKNGTEPITMITSNGARFETRTIDYHGGIKYPHIVRDETYPDYLNEIYHGRTVKTDN
jgi:predicted metalloprotease with PDZ domain